MDVSQPAITPEKRSRFPRDASRSSPCLIAEPITSLPKCWTAEIIGLLLKHMGGASFGGGELHGRTIPLLGVPLQSNHSTLPEFCHRSLRRDQNLESSMWNPTATFYSMAMSKISLTTR